MIELDWADDLVKIALLLDSHLHRLIGLLPIR